MTRIAIIGLGGMGRVHFQQYQKLAASGGAKIVAVADADPTRLGATSAGGWDNLGMGGDKALSLEGIHRTTDWREIIGMAEVDMIDICLPTPLHAEPAIAALKHGKHVLCEKPLAVALEDARAVLEAAEKSRAYFMPAMVMRFWPEWEWMKRTVAEQRYGKVRSATFRRIGSIPGGWFSDDAASGGALFDLHVHDADFICHLFGPPPAVFSRGVKTPAGHAGYIVTQYLYDDIPLIAAEGGFVDQPGFGFQMRGTIAFERATAEFDIGRKQPLMLHGPEKSEHIPGGDTDGYYNEIAYFLDCIKNARPPQRVTAADAVQTLRVLHAERRSIHSGRNEPVG
jgi:predicted dehydrogenase